MARIQLVKAGLVPVQSVAILATESWAFTDSGSVAIGTGTGIISGTVRYSGSPLANAGKVQLYNSGGTLLQTVSVNASGVYTFAGVANGTYYPRLNPKQGASAATSYCIHAGDSGAISGLYSDQPAVVVAGNDPTQDFTVDLAWFADDFSGYADTAALISPTLGFGGSLRGLNFTTSSWFAPANTTNTLNATGGPGGGKCYQHDITSAAFGGGTIGPFGNWSTSLNWKTGGTLYLRVVDWCSASWAFVTEYKQWLNTMNVVAGDPSSTQLAFEYSGSGASPSLHYVSTDTLRTMECSVNVSACIFPVTGPTLGCCPTGFTVRSTWNVWVYEITAYGTTAQRHTIWLNGVKVSACEKNFSNLSGTLRTGQPLGANYNLGTYAAQSRRVAQISVSATRPSLIDVIT